MNIDDRLGPFKPVKLQAKSEKKVLKVLSELKKKGKLTTSDVLIICGYRSYWSYANIRNIVNTLINRKQIKIIKEGRKYFFVPYESASIVAKTIEQKKSTQPKDDGYIQLLKAILSSDDKINSQNQENYLKYQAQQNAVQKIKNELNERLSYQLLECSNNLRHACKLVLNSNFINMREHMINMAMILDEYEIAHTNYIKKIK